ncbi:MAG: PqqD family protein [Bacteroidales bacterium]|nr:PqqD family protein [Bacteroidales bacterium]MCR5277136.1 PqqD family protein [Bacteroidales bacterium]
MKIKEGFRLRHLCGQHIVVGEGVEQINFNKMIVLNDSASYLFEKVQDREFSQQELAKLLTDHYRVDAQRAFADAGAVMQKWIEAGIAE